MQTRESRTKKRSGFSLVELVVVVLIMGILAAVAAPRMFDKMSEAKQSSTKQSLSVVRSAIELYKLETGNYPADPSANLITYLKGPFPTCEVLDSGNANVKVLATDPLAATADTESWIYNKTTGEFRINDGDHITW